MKYQIEVLGSKHDRTAFDCSREELNRWFKEVASQHQEKNISRTFVLVDGDGVVGFYAIAVGEISSENFPKAKRLPRNLPIVRLGRLAVAKAHQGEKLGEHLLMDALLRIFETSKVLGINAVVVDAKDDLAASFYRKYGFESLTDTPLTLVLPVKTLQALFE